MVLILALEKLAVKKEENEPIVKMDMSFLLRIPSLQKKDGEHVVDVMLTENYSKEPEKRRSSICAAFTAPSYRVVL